jgi:uncharacterized membrane protein YgcG
VAGGSPGTLSEIKARALVKPAEQGTITAQRRPKPLVPPRPRRLGDPGPSYATPEGAQADKLVDVLAAAGRRARSCLIDRQDALSRHATGAADALLATTDAAAAAAAGRAAASRRYGFVWAQLHELDGFYWQRAKHARRATQLQAAREAAAAAAEAKAAEAAAAGAEDRKEGQAPPADAGKEGPCGGGGCGSEDSDEAALARAAQEVESEAAAVGPPALLSRLRELDAAVGSLLAALPPNALLVVATGQGDMAEVRRRQETKIRRQQGLDGLPPWSTSDDAAFGEMLERELMGLCFCAVKGAGSGGAGGEGAAEAGDEGGWPQEGAGSGGGSEGGGGGSQSR